MRREMEMMEMELKRQHTICAYLKPCKDRERDDDHPENSGSSGKMLSLQISHKLNLNGGCVAGPSSPTSWGLSRIDTWAPPSSSTYHLPWLRTY